MKRLILFVLTGLILANHSVMAEDLPDTSEVSIKIINNNKDPFDKRIILTDRATLKVIKTIHTKELDPWPMNDVAANMVGENGSKWFVDREKASRLPEERLHDYQNNVTIKKSDLINNTIQLIKIIEIKISKQGHYFIIRFIYRLADYEGGIFAGRMQVALFSITGNKLGFFHDDLIQGDNRSYFTDDDGYYTFGYMKPPPPGEISMENPTTGLKIFQLPSFKLIKTYIYPKDRRWRYSTSWAQGQNIFTMLNGPDGQWGFEVIQPNSMTLFRKVYANNLYRYYKTTTPYGVEMKNIDGSVRIDSINSFERRGF
ncbi:MAG: hypothetical protein K9N34_10580 [Candidatus Marinimicrobia bacterium]|nr:hypothetical protein [Candidatus Neomarinimicrobiota bacterium]